MTFKSNGVFHRMPHAVRRAPEEVGRGKTQADPRELPDRGTGACASGAGVHSGLCNPGRAVFLRYFPELKVLDLA